MSSVHAIENDAVQAAGASGERSARGSLLGRLSRRLGVGRVRFLRVGTVYILVMAFLFFGSLIGRANLLMLLFAMMAGVFVLNGWAIVWLLRKLSAARKLPTHVFAGELFSVELEVTNRKRWFGSWALVARDCVRPARPDNRRDEVFEPGVLFARIPPRSKRLAAYRGVLERGRYRFGPIRLSTRFPLGFVERAAFSEAQEEMLVYPRLGRLAPGWHRQWAELQQQVARARRTVMPDEFHGLRDFLPGDSTRLIHWRTSARTGELKVREFEQLREQGMAVLLDLYVPSSEPTDGDRSPGAGEGPSPEARQSAEALEAAVSFAATLCARACKTGGARFLLGLAGADLAIREGPASAGLLHELLAALAEAEGTAAADPRALLRAACDRIGPRQSIVLVSPRPLEIDVAQLDRSPSQRGVRRRLVLVDTTSDRFGHLFRLS